MLLASQVTAQRPFERLQRGWDDIRPRGQLLREIFGPTESDEARQKQIEQQRRAAQQRQQQQAQTRQNYRTPQQPRRMGSALEEPKPAQGYANQRSRQQRPQSRDTGYPTRLEIAVKESKTPAGLQVDQVSTRGAAWAAGIRRGDIIVSVGGIETANKDDLSGITQVLKDGDQIEFEIMRRGNKETVLVQFGEAPADTVIENDQGEGPAYNRFSDSDNPAATAPPRRNASRTLQPRSGMRSVLDEGVTSRKTSGATPSWQVQPPSSRISQTRSSQIPGKASPAGQTHTLNPAEVKQLQRQLRQQQEQIQLLQRQLTEAKESPADPNQPSNPDSLLDFPK